MWLCTFHAMCVRILREDADKLGFRPNFTIYDDDDSKRLVKSIMSDLGIEPKQFPINGIRSRISSAKNALVLPDEFEGLANTPPLTAAARVYRELQARLERANAMDFDDLLINAHRLLRDHPDVLEKYQRRFIQISVDEYQDTNHVQYEITNMLAAARRNLMVADSCRQEKFSDHFRAAVFFFIKIHVIGSVQFKDPIGQMAGIATDLRLNFILEIIIKRIVFRQMPQVLFAHFFSPHLFNRSPDFRNLPHAPPYCKRSSIQKTKEETTEAKDFLRRKHETVRPQAPEYRRKPDFSQKELVSVLAMTEPEIMFTDSSKFKKGEWIMENDKKEPFKHAKLQQWLFVIICAILLIFIGAITA